MALGQHLRHCLQCANQTQDPQQRRLLLTVAVISAGSSGVEMAASQQELLPRWYGKLGGNSQEIRVVILNRSKEILKGDPSIHLREPAQKALKQCTVPVELLLEVSASAIRPNQVECKRHDQLEMLPAATIIWTAGNITHALIKNLPIPQEHRDQHDRICVIRVLQLPDFPEVFAGSDCVAEGDKPLPLTAQVRLHDLKASAAGDDLGHS